MSAFTRSGADLNSLNEQQRAVVLTTDTPCCVVSIPGSGKTKTITEKIVHLLTGHEFGLSKAKKRVIAVTFTSEAGKELTERTKARIGREAGERMATGTFHSLFMQALRRQGAALTDRRLASTGQSEQWMDRAIEKCMPKLWEEATTDRMLADLRGRIEEARCKLTDPYGLEKCEDENDVAEAGMLESAVKTYREMMAHANLFDFGMILEETLRFLETEGDIERNKSFAETQSKFRDEHGYDMNWSDEFVSFVGASYMLVDEAQDIDEVQLGIILSIAQHGVIVDLVGDDDQSIYGFRFGLGYKGMTTFAEKVGAKTILLENNYRCRTEIMELAGAIISQNSEERRTKKRLSAKRGRGGDVTLNEFARGDKELDELVKSIRSVKPGPNGEMPSIAVIGRMNKILDEVQSAFTRQEGKIPHERLGGASIWGVAPVCFFIALLEGLVHKSDVATMDQCFYWAGIKDKNARPKSKEGHLVAQMHEITAKCRKVVWSKEPKVVQKIIVDCYSWFAMAINESDWSDKKKDFLKSRLQMAVGILAGKKAVKDTVILERGKGEQKSTENAAPNVNASESSGLVGSLGDRLKTLRHLDRTGKKESATVKIVSMHGSKGLEFDFVWIVGLDDQTMPGTDLPKEIKEPVKELSEDQLERLRLFNEANEEERRLMYVAITRARDNLHLSWSQVPIRNPKAKTKSTECRFLAALPQNSRPRTSVKVDENYKRGSTII